MKQSKSETAYSQVPKGINFDIKYENQKKHIKEAFDIIAFQIGYISGAEAFRTMRTYHRKIKEAK